MLKIGDTIYLEAGHQQNEIERFKCRVVEKQGAYILIDVPVNVKTKRSGIFSDGTQFKAWFVGDDKTLYLFETELRNRVNREIPMLMIDAPAEKNLIRLQRRKFMRVDTAVDAAVHASDRSFTPFTTVTIDLSGGGAAIVLPAGHSIQDDMQIFCWFALPLQSGEIVYLKAPCNVVRVFKEKQSDREKASLQFLSISDNERQSIIRFCFEQELYLRRKGVK